MIELSMHILDIVENSTRAGATMVTVRIMEDMKLDTLSIEITDDGEGMDSDSLKKALDPFYTSKEVRHVGLGLPMLYQATQSSEGNFFIESTKGKGTRVKAEFKHSHIDRQPIGDMGGTIMTLVAGNPDVDFEFTYRTNESTYTFDTREIRKEIENVPLNNPEILQFIRENITEGLKEIGAHN
jgi:hypothetical protein